MNPTLADRPAPPLFSAQRRIFWSRIIVALTLAYVAFVPPPAFLGAWARALLEITGLALLVTAAFGRVWCLVFVAGRKNAELVTDGPYSMVRNPLYVFSFIGVVGFGLAVENPLLAGALALVFGLYYAGVVRREERCLARAFGEAFAAYAARTPRWIPDFRAYREPERLLVHPAQIRAGILDATWFIWAFVLWELLEAVRALA